MESENIILIQMGLLIFLSTYLVNCFDITIDIENVHRVVNRNFLNMAIDTGTVRRNWENFCPNSTRVRTLAQGLAPCYLRIGGTDADFLLFINDKVSDNKRKTLQRQSIFYQNLKKNDKVRRGHQATGSRRDFEITESLTNFTMTASFYDQIHEFVSSVGWDLIFDLNSLLRKPDGSWDPSNAIELINYTAQSGYKMGGWELGNEPDEYTDGKIQHKLVTPEQLSRDFEHLRKILKGFPSFSDCQILGPSIAAMSNYWRKGFFYSFLSSGGGDVVTAATFHQYYEDGAVAKVGDFYNPDILNVLYEEIQAGINLTLAAGSSAKVWLGETSSAWRSGAPNISDRYVAAFPWLDKLGMSARDGIDAVVRQTFYGGHYALLDYDTLDPNPDYWLTLIYKLLVGNRVLRVISLDSSGELRVYAHCTETQKANPYPADRDHQVIANSLEPAQMPSNSASNQVPNCLPLSQYFFKILNLSNCCLLQNTICCNGLNKDMDPEQIAAMYADLHGSHKGIRSGYSPGSITVYILNLGTSSKLVNFSQFPPGTTYHVYNMSPPGNDLLSKFVTLNGKLLRMVNDETLPNLLQPEKKAYNVTIPALTYCFIVIPDANLSVCM